jgi:hypothetical protein
VSKFLTSLVVYFIYHNSNICTKPSEKSTETFVLGVIPLFLLLLLYVMYFAKNSYMELALFPIKEHVIFKHKKSYFPLDQLAIKDKNFK